jgi:Zn-finger nucleic acid-binding protein
MEPIKIVCSSCKQEFNQAMKLCPFCGAEREVTIAVKDINCPVCKVQLESGEFNKENVFSCPSCKGFWLNKTEFEILTSERNTILDDSIPKTFLKSKFETRTNYVSCPVCGKIMTRVNFGRISGIIIDICGDHGAWFDAKELELIRTFVANSGLQKAQDKQIENNKQDIDLLKYKVRDLELMEKILHKWKINRIRYRGI